MDRRAVILNLRDGFSDMRDLLGYQEALMALLVDGMGVHYVAAQLAVTLLVLVTGYLANRAWTF